ncbi:hypothetical protein ACW23B_29015 [Streptomyces albidoflavus]
MPRPRWPARSGWASRDRDLERGTLPRLDPRVLDPLADVLLLDADERATLHRHACGGTQPFALWRACKYCVRM